MIVAELLVHALGGSIKIEQARDEPGIHNADIETAGIRYDLQHAAHCIKKECGIDPDKKDLCYAPGELEEFRQRLRQNGAYRCAFGKLLSWSMFGDAPKRQLMVTQEMIALLPAPDWDELVLAWCPPLMQRVSSHTGSKGHQLAFCGVFPCCAVSEPVVIAPASWSTVHSFAVQLQRQPEMQYSFCGNAEPIAQIGFTVTKNKEVVFGIRAGSYEQDKIALLPAGSAAWPSLATSFCNEAREELAVLPEHLIRPPQLAGIYRCDGRLLFVYVLETTLTSAEMYEQWKGAEDKYEHRDIFFYPVELLNTADIRKHVKTALHIDADWSRVALPALCIGEAHYSNNPKSLISGFANQEQIWAALK